jgi:FkbM family methyltransferase
MGLVIDLGMHVGDDTAYYLARGHRVIAVEANPALVRQAQQRFAREIADGALTILNVALSDQVGTAKFFISKVNAEWSSLEQWRAASTGDIEEINVETLTLADIIARYGDPDFIKCDIEGADGIFCHQLIQLPKKPRYVSVEAISIDWIALLVAARYTHFQLVNQAFIRRMPPTMKFMRDGREQSWTFSGHASGPFGDDLPNEWTSFQEVARRWLDFQRLKAEAPGMVLDNWFDVHARL